MGKVVMRWFAALSFALALAGAGPAGAAGNKAAPEEFQKYAFTPAKLDKYLAAAEEVKKLPKKRNSDKDDNDEKDDPSIDDMARQFDAMPGVKSILSKYGFSSREYALATMAMFNAAFYLGMESSMEKKGREELYAGYPKETQANIELLRKHPQFMKKK